MPPSKQKAYFTDGQNSLQRQLNENKLVTYYKVENSMAPTAHFILNGTIVSFHAAMTKT